MFDKLKKVVDCIDFETVSDARKETLQVLIAFISQKIEEGFPIALNFICTHNSRRSQFSQLWAKVAADFYGIDADCFSGGVEVTAFNKNAVDSLIRFGFKMTKEGVENPIYAIRWDDVHEPIKMYSKLYDDPLNSRTHFAAIMTCAHADENCPVVMGCEQRIPIRYSDPKKYDNTPLQNTMYDHCSFRIATEMFYVFSQIEK
ncbi:Arsenate reductase [Parvicella tangerina]|uniref:Arsenate reductase n=2 Tax=Parvicella tangerina TaxID=2829795 RepID=A0A916NPG1_9FLAO|nr:Arsenate reductase [Parvicella tangerina]